MGYIMLINTRYFGQVDVGEDKIIHFEEGLFGFEEYKDYTILYDSDADGQPFFSWLQSVTEKGLAFPVVGPQTVCEDYNPTVEDALMDSLGEMGDEDLVVLLLATVPKDVKKTSVNMKAPLIINASTCMGRQIVVENTDYEIKHYVMQEG